MQVLPYLISYSVLDVKVYILILVPWHAWSVLSGTVYLCIQYYLEYYLDCYLEIKFVISWALMNIMYVHVLSMRILLLSFSTFSNKSINFVLNLRL